MREKSASQTLFLGRETEVALLQQKNWRKRAELIVIYGRRRVGKTALVGEAYRNELFWKFEGLEGEPVQKQIQHFLASLSDYTGKQIDHPHTSDWRESLATLAQHLPQKKMVLFFDEFQWLAGMKSGFVSLFKYFWDNHFKQHPDLKVVLCGSVSSFIVKKVLQSKALYGRVDLEINLKPLKIKETGPFFTPPKTKDELIQIQMTLGGIPQYLEELQPDFSLIQNLNEQAFRPHGYFFQEYRRLFISHFSQSPLYEKVIQNLSGGPLSADSIASECHIKTGGALTEKLADLEMAGFIKKETPFDKGPKSKLVRYRLDDEYLHFYFRFIKPHIPKILSGHFSFESLLPQRDFRQWQGYAFERLCFKHTELIAQALGFSGINYQCGPWFARGSGGKTGVQVDLVFDRADSMLTICEMKYMRSIHTAHWVRDFEKKCEILRDHFPGQGQQKVLILGRPARVNAALWKYFDKILYAHEIFWSA